MSPVLYNPLLDPLTSEQLRLLRNWCQGRLLENVPSGSFYVGNGLEFWCRRRWHACPVVYCYFADSEIPVCRFFRKRGKWSFILATSPEF